MHNLLQQPRAGLSKNRGLAPRLTEDGVAWNGFECKCLACGTTNCKMWMSMMVQDEMDMEHEVAKCGMCIIKEINVVKGEKELWRKEVGELMVQGINKEKGCI